MSNNLSKHTLGLTQLQSGQGAPSHQAPLGSLYINVSTSDYYKNTDGNTSWVVLITTGSTFTDNYVTGGTYSNGTLTLDRQNGSVIISGFTTETITAGENLVYGDLVYLSGDSKYYKSSNSSESTSSTELRISLDTINSNDTGVALIKGKFTTVGLTPGDIYIVGYSAGTITNTEPITDGSIIRIVGTALDSTTLEFNPDQTYIEIDSTIPSVNPITGCIPDLYVTNLHSCSPLYINPNNEGNIYFGSANNFVVDLDNGRIGIGTASPTSELDLGLGTLKAGTVEVNNITISSPNSISISNVDGLQTALDSKADNIAVSSHINDLNNPHQTTFFNLTSTAHTHTTSEISDLSTELNLKTNLSDFVLHTGNTNNPHQTSFNQLTSTAHTHTISDITDLNNQLNNKLNSSGGIINGNLTVNGNFVTLGSATTINTETLAIKDNLLSLNSNLTGGTEPFFGDSGIQIIRGSATTSNLLWSESSNYWVAGLSGSTKKIILQGDNLSLLNSAHTHTISEVINLNNELNNKFNASGGTISGNVTIIGTLSATTLYGNGQYLTGLVTNDFYVTGGTFMGTTLTLNRQNGSVTITGFTSGGGSGTFTGGTISGNLTLSSLTGTTDRMLEVDSTGFVSAERTIISAYLTSGSTEANLLEDTNNWGNKVYSGTTITGTYQGQKHYNSDYLFEAVDNNLWIRLSRV